MTLILRRLLASSTFAISGTLEALASKLDQAKALTKFSEVVTIEDHLLDGGFGSWLMEAKSLNKSVQCSINPIALSSNVCGTVGSQHTLNTFGNLFKN